MSSQFDDSTTQLFGEEGEQGEVEIPTENESIQAVVKRELVCEADDSYMHTVLSITAAGMRVEVPLENCSAIELGKLLKEAGSED